MRYSGIVIRCVSVKCGDTLDCQALFSIGTVLSGKVMSGKVSVQCGGVISGNGLVDNGMV